MDNLETDMKETLITLASDIVAAHVSNNEVTVDQLPTLITNVYGALASVGEDTGAHKPRSDPAVAIRSSVKKDYIVCLDCGRKMKMLKRHLSTEHGLTIDEYRARWQLPGDYPVVAPNYAETRRTLAKKIGLGRKPGQKPRAKARGRRKKS